MTAAKTMLDDACPSWCADGPHPFEADGGDPKWAARWHHLPIGENPVSVVIDGCDLIDGGTEESTVVINVAEEHLDRLRELSPADARQAPAQK